MVQYNNFKIFVTKKTHFKNLFIGVKNYVKKARYLLNGFLKSNQRKKNSSIKSLTCNDIKYKANSDISNKLNQFFAAIGRDISCYFYIIASEYSIYSQFNFIS